MICVVKLCCAPRQTHILMTCTCNCSMHIQHNVMQLFHANSAPACTRSRSPHNVLHSPSYWGERERAPHRRVHWGERERAPHRRVQCEFSLFLYFYISIYIYIVRRAVNHFLLLFARSLLKLLQRTRYVDVRTRYVDVRTLLRMQRTSHVDYFAICV